MSMRSWIDLVEGILDEDDAPLEWRAWIDPKGEEHEVHGDETHAEWAYGYQVTDDNWEDDPDVGDAFATHIENGWIRVGVNISALEFYVTLEEEFTTRPALERLLKMVQDTPAQSFSISNKHAMLGRKRFQTLVTRMLLQKRKMG